MPDCLLHFRRRIRSPRSEIPRAANCEADLGPPPIVLVVLLGFLGFLPGNVPIPSPLVFADRQGFLFPAATFGRAAI
jgi:hypothetical protein